MQRRSGGKLDQPHRHPRSKASCAAASSEGGSLEGLSPAPFLSCRAVWSKERKRACTRKFSATIPSCTRCTTSGKRLCLVAQGSAPARTASRSCIRGVEKLLTPSASISDQWSATYARRVACSRSRTTSGAKPSAAARARMLASESGRWRSQPVAAVLARCQLAGGESDGNIASLKCCEKLIARDLVARAPCDAAC